MEEVNFMSLVLTKAANGYVVNLAEDGCTFKPVRYVAESKDSLKRLLLGMCGLQESDPVIKLADPEAVTDPAIPESDAPIADQPTEKPPMSREKLIEYLESRGVVIPKSTRTTTLQRWVDEEAAKEELELNLCPTDDSEGVDDSDDASVTPGDEDLLAPEDDGGDLLVPDEDECFLCEGNGSLVIPKLGEIKCTQCGGTGKGAKAASADTLRALGNTILKHEKAVPFREVLMGVPLKLFGCRSVPDVPADELQATHIKLLKGMIDAVEGADGCLI